jgi:hypothetical protein
MKSNNLLWKERNQKSSSLPVNCSGVVPKIVTLLGMHLKVLLHHVKNMVYILHTLLYYMKDMTSKYGSEVDMHSPSTIGDFV